MSDEHIKVLRELRHDLSNFDGGPPNPRDIAALDAALAALGGVEAVEYRMFDSQWVNVVNHERAYEGWDKTDAINHAVRLTEQAMANNIRDGKWPKPHIAPAPPSKEG